MKENGLLVNRAEISRRLGIGYANVEAVLAKIGVVPVVSGHRPIYIWGDIAARLSGPATTATPTAGAEAPHVEAIPEPPKPMIVTLHTSMPEPLARRVRELANKYDVSLSEAARECLKIGLNELEKVGLGSSDSNAQTTP